MQKILIIVCWFGPYPNYFALWKKSVARNPDVDFLIVGDRSPGEDAPSNLRWQQTTLPDLEQRIRRELGDDRIVVPRSYKLCDFKPMYGEIFARELAGYDFWGHCDLDLVFGFIRTFLTEEKLGRYDKIYPCGHLSVFRNTPEVNARWRLPLAKFSLDDVLTRDLNFAFDEWNGIYNIYMRKGFPFHREIEFYAVWPYMRRFCFPRDRGNPKYERQLASYSHQCFYWEDGRVLRAFIDGTGEIHRDEGCYIHLQKRVFPAPSPEVVAADAFFCTPMGFLPKPGKGLPAREDILRMNPFKGELYERLERWFAVQKRKALKFLHLRKGPFAPRSMRVKGASWEPGRNDPAESAD